MPPSSGRYDIIERRFLYDSFPQKKYQTVIYFDMKPLLCLLQLPWLFTIAIVRVGFTISAVAAIIVLITATAVEYFL